MTLIEFPGFPDLYQSGTNTGNYVAGVVDKAADFACGLYQDFPGAIIQSPAGAFNRGLMDSLCAPRNKLPPASSQPTFTGGQCPCVFYTVFLTQHKPSGDESFTVTVPAPIGGLVRKPNETFPDITDVFLAYAVCEGGVQTGTRADLVGADSQVGGASFVTIDSVVRADGEPDTCGNPNPGWGGDYPREIPDERKSDNVTIDNPDGTNITLPVAIIGSGNVITFKPEFNIDVGGIKVTFDFSGAKVDFGNKNTNTTQPRDRNNSNTDDFDRLESLIKDVKNQLNQQQKDIDAIKKNKNDTPPPDDDPDIEKDTDETESDQGERTVDKLEWVCIHLTKYPNREQWGGGSPDIYYAGWLEFKVKDCILPRQPIHFENSIFKAPDGATGFAYTMTNGAKGKATVYRSKSVP